MTADAASATAVNSAIMAAADQILAGLKGGNLFPSSPPAAPQALPISHVAASLSQTTTGEINSTKNNEAQRCSPTGVHQQHEQCAPQAAEVTNRSYHHHPYPNDSNCVSQSSTCAEAADYDMNKTASASSLTSSEHSHGGDKRVEVVVPPMQQVTFASGNHHVEEGDGAGGNKRSLPAYSHNAAAMEPPAQRPRVHQEHQDQEPASGTGQQVVAAPADGQSIPAATGASAPYKQPGHEGQVALAPSQPQLHEGHPKEHGVVLTAQTGGQDRPPDTTAAALSKQQCQLERQHQGAQVPGQSTFQPILPTPPPPTQPLQPPFQPQNALVAAQQVQHPVPLQPRNVHQDSPAKDHTVPYQPSVAAPAPSVPVPSPLKATAQTAAPFEAPRQVQQRQDSYYSHLSRIPVPGQVPIAPAPPALITQGPHQETYAGHGQTPAQGQQSYSTGYAPRAPNVPVASPQTHKDGSYQGQVQQPQAAVQAQKYVAIAPAPTHVGHSQVDLGQVNASQSQSPPRESQPYGTVHQTAAAASDASRMPPYQQHHPQHQQQPQYCQIQPKDAHSKIQHPSPAAPIIPTLPPTHYHHQQSAYSHIQPRPPRTSETQTSGYQATLPPIYPRPCPPLQHHDHQPKQALQQATTAPEQPHFPLPPQPPPPPPQQPQQPPPPPQFTYNCGVPTLPHASQIETASIQLDHMNHQEPHSTTTQGSSHATATLAAAPSPNTHAHHHHHLPPHNSVNKDNNSCRQPTAVVATALRRPSFPPPPGAKTPAAPTTTDRAPTAPSAHAPQDVAPNLRNQRMQPTDCLLFAASLLQEAPATGPPAPRVATKHHEASVFKSHEATPIPHKNGQHHSSPPPLAVVNAQYAAQDKTTASPTIAPQPARLPLPAYPSSPSPAQAQQDQPKDLDVLCGRGGLINKHIGNIIYRRVVEHNKPFYQSVQKRHRILVSQSIVHTILNRGGRFLSEDTQTITNEDGTRTTVTWWKPVPTARAIQKTSQALRERVANERAGTDPASKSSKSDGTAAEVREGAARAAA